MEVVINDGSRYVERFGNVVTGQYLLGLTAQYMLKRLGEEAKGKYIVANDATSYLVKEIAEKLGAEFVEAGTGEVNVVDKMLELGAVVSGEGSSSGFIHPETRCRDGILTMLYTLAITAEEGTSLGNIIDKPSFPEHYTLRDDNQICNPDSIYGVKSYIRSHFKNQGYRISEPDEFSGIKAIDKEENWVWFRASFTTLGQFRIFSDSGDYKIASSLLKDGISVFQEAKNGH